MSRILFKTLLFMALVATIDESSVVRAGAIVTVSGQSNPYLAGLPNGATAQNGDSAPQQSPLEVSGFSIVPGDTFYFSATGAVANYGTNFSGPDGGVVFSRGAENGIAGYTITANSLLGVFLGPVQPDLSAAPAALDFGSSASRDFLTLFPLLKQPFFIGDGLTSTSIIQAFVVPTGATRLFLGTADGNEWSNNPGSFSVEVSNSTVVTNAAVPEPTGLVMLVVGSLVCASASQFSKRTMKRRSTSLA